MIKKAIQFILVNLFLATPSMLFAEEQWPSNTLKEEFAQWYGNRTAEQLQASVTSQPQPGLVTAVWTIATRASHVDNRAYLIALAFDLYNTLPPDLKPEPQKLGPDEDVCEECNAPYKAQSYGNMYGLKPEYAMPLEQKIERWEYIKRTFSPENQVAAIEMRYIFDFVTEQMAQGNIVLDASDAPASLDPTQLDITNPTHYKAIREHMEKMQPAINAGIPPWEAERYLATQGSAQTKPNTTTSTVQTTDEPNPTTQQTPMDTQTIIYNQPRWVWYALLIGLIVVVTVVVTGALYLRRKK